MEKEFYGRLIGQAGIVVMRILDVVEDHRMPNIFVGYLCPTNLSV